MAQQDSSRSTRGGSVNHVYQEQQIDEQVRRCVGRMHCGVHVQALALAAAGTQPSMQLKKHLLAQAVQIHNFYISFCQNSCAEPLSGQHVRCQACLYSPQSLLMLRGSCSTSRLSWSTFWQQSLWEQQQQQQQQVVSLPHQANPQHCQQPFQQQPALQAASCRTALQQLQQRSLLLHA